MKCEKCGRENEKDAKFCEFCGNPISGESAIPVREKEKGRESGKKNGRKVFFCLAIIILLGAAVIAGLLILRSSQEKERYEELLASGDKYMEEMDYSNAEAAYLEAIKIEPKQKEPYLQLVNIYIEQEDYDKVIYIAEEAEDKVPDEDKDTFSAIVDEYKNIIEYEWVVEPEIEADDIYYLKDGNTLYFSENELNKQMNTGYAVIRRGDLYGLIGLDGALGAEIEYKRIYTLCDWYGMERLEARYEPEFQWNMTDYYFVEEENGGEVKPAVAVVGDQPKFTGTYYYCNGLYNTWESKENEYSSIEIPEQAIPIKQSEVKFDETQNLGWDEAAVWWTKLPGGYAVYQSDHLITGFDYEECGSSSDGLIAVKKDGKWGYINESGEIVIPFEFDASWNQFVQCESANVEGEKMDYCYAAAYGYVVLRQGEKWKLCNTLGTTCIPFGVFEEIRPVQKENKCWVKKNGKWGVICLPAAENEKKEEPEEDRQGMLQMLKDMTGVEPTAEYYEDFTGDGTKEMMAVYQLDDGVKCQVWYCDGDKTEQLFDWDNQGGGNSYCNLSGHFVYVNKEGKAYLVVNTWQRVAMSYNSGMVFGMNDGGNVAQVYQIEGTIQKDVGNLIVTEEKTDLSESIPQTYSEVYKIDIINGNVERILE